MTEVPLREHIDQRLRDLEIRLTEGRSADHLAVDKALTSAKELADKHNDLIHQGEKKDETYATKIELNSAKAELSRDITRLAGWQAKVSGGLVVIGAIGLANFVKVFTG